MTQALTVAGRQVAEWTPEQIDIVRRQMIRGGQGGRVATDAELAYFAQVCRHTNLDPFRRQVWGIIRSGELTIQTSIDGYRAIAGRNPNYQGQVGPQWCGEDGEWRDIWLSREHPAAARVGVFRKGFREPVWGIAIWSEYAPKNQNGTRWGDMPAHMLAKCAEANAIRKCFSEDMGGVYTAEEMTVEAVEAVDITTGEVLTSTNAAATLPHPEATPLYDSDGNRVLWEGRHLLWRAGGLECITTEVPNRGTWLKTTGTCLEHPGAVYYLSPDAPAESWAHGIRGTRESCRWADVQARGYARQAESEPGRLPVTNEEEAPAVAEQAPFVLSSAPA